MTDIVERLRGWERVDILDAHEDGALYNAAADEIERLRKALKLAVFTDSEYAKLLEDENSRFREALRKIADNEVVGYPTVDGIRDFAYVVLEGK